MAVVICISEEIGFVSAKLKIYLLKKTMKFQITPPSVRLINTATKKLVSEWSHPGGKNISLGSCNQTQVVVAAGSELFLLEIQAGAIKQVR